MEKKTTLKEPIKEECTVVKEKIYTIKHYEMSDGSFHVRRVCDGFNAYELLGVLEFTQQEIMQQITGRIKPDFIKREVVDD